MKLGYRAHNIRYRGDFIKLNDDYKDMLDKLGFQWVVALKDNNYSNNVSNNNRNNSRS